MSIAALVECSNELRRLTIAGSDLAPGDFRLQRLVEPLRASGERAAVFNKVADAVEVLIESDKKSASRAMLDLGVLVNAILYTQGVTEVEGDTGEIDTYEVPFLTTRTSARVMKPLVEALTTTGGGRYNVINDAFERGAFKDLRLIQPAIAALDDGYGDIAELMKKEVLPSYGAAIVPFLGSIDVRGRRLDGRMLELLGSIAPERAWPICQDALENGKSEMKAAALRAMAGDPRSLEPLIEYATKARGREVRQAALDGLAKHDDPAAIEVLVEELRGNNIEAVIQAVQANPSPRLAELLLTETTTQWEQVLAGDTKASLVRLQSLLECFAHRTEPDLQAVVIECFKQRDKLRRPGKTKAAKEADYLVDVITQVLSTLRNETAIDLLASAHGDVSDDHLPLAYRAACRAWPPKKVYDAFAPYLKDGGKGRATGFSEYLRYHYGHYHYRYYGRGGLTDDYEAMSQTNTDPRWLALALKLDDERLVRRFYRAAPDNKSLHKWLLKRHEANDTNDTNALRTLIEIGHPKATKLWIDGLGKQMKKTGWQRFRYLDHILTLPEQDLDQIKAALEQLPEDQMDRAMDVLAARLAELANN